MIESAHSPQDHSPHSPERRSILMVLGTASLALPVALLAGCQNAVPPGQVTRPKSYIRGHNGNNGSGHGNR